MQSAKACNLTISDTFHILYPVNKRVHSFVKGGCYASLYAVWKVTYSVVFVDAIT